MSYFTGIFWFVISEMNADGDTGFIEEFGVLEKTNGEKIILLTYFSFTTLSTVGFGDYHPISNIERAVGAFILLGGVNITSLIMDRLMGMVDKLRNLNKEYEETDKLS